MYVYCNNIYSILYINIHYHILACIYIYIPSICIYIYILIGVPIMGIQRALGEVRNADGPVDPWVPCLDTTDFSYSSVVSLLVASRFSLRIYHIINFVYVPTFVDKFVGLRTSYGLHLSLHLLRSKSDCYDCEKFDPMQTMGHIFWISSSPIFFFGQLDWNFTKACDT